MRISGIPFGIGGDEVKGGLSVLDKVLKVIIALDIEVDEEDECDENDFDEQGDEIGEWENGTDKIADDTRDVETGNGNRSALTDVFVV